MDTQQQQQQQHQRHGESISSLEDQKKQLDRHGYLFGQKITHSLSPFLHQIIYDTLGLKWSQIRLDSADMSQFLRLVQDQSFYGTLHTVQGYRCCQTTNTSVRRLRHHAQQGGHPAAPG